MFQNFISSIRLVLDGLVSQKKQNRTISIRLMKIKNQTIVFTNGPVLVAQLYLSVNFIMVRFFGYYMSIPSFVYVANIELLRAFSTKFYFIYLTKKLK